MPSQGVNLETLLERLSLNVEGQKHQLGTVSKKCLFKGLTVLEGGVV